MHVPPSKQSLCRCNALHHCDAVGTCCAWEWPSGLWASLIAVPNGVSCPSSYKGNSTQYKTNHKTSKHNVQASILGMAWHSIARHTQAQHSIAQHSMA